MLVRKPIEIIEATTSQTITGLLALLYGDNGTGKTSFARDFHGPEGRSLILATDANWRSLKNRPNVVELPDWATLVRAVETVDFTPFDTVALDTVTFAIDACQAFVCSQLGITHPSDLEFGKGWNAVRVELSKVLEKLESKCRNVLYLAHEKVFDFQSPGMKRTKVTAMMPDSAGNRVRGVVALTGRIEIADKTGERLLAVTPSLSRHAKIGEDLQSIIGNGPFPLDGRKFWDQVFRSDNA